MGKAIMDSMAVFTEAFEQIHLMEDDLAHISSRVDFIHLFSDVKDFRVPGKTKYKLGNLLMLILLVKYTTRSTSFFEIALHIKAREKYFSELGLIEDHQCPSHDTLRRVMMCLDGNALQEQTIKRLYDFLRDLEKENKESARHRQIAMDGKEMCGSGRSKKQNIHYQTNSSLTSTTAVLRPVSIARTLTPRRMKSPSPKCCWKRWI